MCFQPKKPKTGLSSLLSLPDLFFFLTPRTQQPPSPPTTLVASLITLPAPATPTIHHSRLNHPSPPRCKHSNRNPIETHTPPSTSPPPSTNRPNPHLCRRSDTSTTDQIPLPPPSRTLVAPFLPAKQVYVDFFQQNWCSQTWVVSSFLNSSVLDLPVISSSLISKLGFLGNANIKVV